MKFHQWILSATNMAILAVNEVIPRGYSHQLGGSPTASMTFVCTVDSPTGHGAAIAATGYELGSSHPDFSFLECSSIEVTEPDPWHIEVQLSFALRPAEAGEPGQLPYALPDVWSFSTGRGQAACTDYFPDAGNNVLKASLVNAANDAFEGIVRDEPELRASIQGFRQLFPAGAATRLTSAINNAGFAGGAKHTWQCSGISGTPQREVIGGEPVEFWQISVELLYRRSTHNLFLPNAGLNYLENGDTSKKKRCWVLDEEGEKVPSAGPMALEADGSLKQSGPGPYPPDILEFRIYPEENFSAFFGAPPPTVTF